MSTATKKTPASRNGGSAAAKKLPLLGSKKAAPLKKVEVEIPGQGVRAVLQQLSVEQFAALQEEATQREDDDTTSSLVGEVRMVSAMMVEPKLSPDELREVVGPWPEQDWLMLEQAAIRLMRVSEEVQAAAEEIFRKAKL